MRKVGKGNASTGHINIRLYSELSQNMSAFKLVNKYCAENQFVGH